MVDGTPFNKIARSVVADDAVKTVKQMILDGELEANDRLPPERDLAEMLGVSRPTLREAIRALVALNLLESRHGEGTFVTSLDPVLLSEPIDFVVRLNASNATALTEVRRYLEPGAAALAAERITPAEVGLLEKLAAEYEECLDDVQACIALDIDIHRQIAESARNPILISLLSSLRALSAESRQRTAHDYERRRQTIAQHRELIAALRSGDTDEAYAAMAQHLGHVAKAVTEEFGPASTP